jgi:hypothetical protein
MNILSFVGTSIGFYYHLGIIYSGRMHYIAMGYQLVNVLNCASYFNDFANTFMARHKGERRSYRPVSVSSMQVRMTIPTSMDFYEYLVRLNLRFSDILDL